MTSTTIYPVADGVGIASAVAVGLAVAVVVVSAALVVAVVVFGRAVMVMGIVSETRAHAGGSTFDSAVLQGSSAEVDHRSYVVQRSAIMVQVLWGRRTKELPPMLVILVGLVGENNICGRIFRGIRASPINGAFLAH